MLRSEVWEHGDKKWREDRNSARCGERTGTVQEVKRGQEQCKK
jgi:hypothetical protein